MLFTSFPAPVEKNSVKWKIHLFVSLFNGIKVFSCLFREKEEHELLLPFEVVFAS